MDHVATELSQGVLDKLMAGGELNDDLSLDQLSALLRRVHGDEATKRVVVATAVDPAAATQFLAGMTEHFGTPQRWLQQWDLAARVGCGEHHRLAFTEHDMETRHKWQHLWQAVRDGECDEWELEGPEFVLALALILDQVSRKLYLNTRDAYANDAAAHALAYSLVESGEAASLPAPLQLLLALPLLHSTDRHSLECARTYVAQVAARVQDNAFAADVAARLAAAAELNIAQLAAFGRFPARNTAHGLVNTPAEDQFLTTGVL